MTKTVQRKKKQCKKRNKKIRKTLRKMNNSVKRIKSKQQGHMNVIEKLVKDAETLISDTEDFSQIKFSRLRAMKKKLGDSRLAMEKFDRELDEAFAEEEEVDESAVTENVEKCQAALMLLEECICAIEFFEEDFAKEKALALQVGSSRSYENPNAEEVVDLSTGKRALEETRLDEESGFDAGVIRHTDTRATTGSALRQTDVIRSGRTVGFNVENLTSPSRYRDGNPVAERDEVLRFGSGQEPSSGDQWSSAGIGRFPTNTQWAERQGSIWDNRSLQESSRFETEESFLPHNLWSPLNQIHGSVGEGAGRVGLSATSSSEVRTVGAVGEGLGDGNKAAGDLKDSEERDKESLTKANSTECSGKTDDKVLSALKIVRLPKVDLPKFDGNVDEWLNFRDFFGHAVHENKFLSKIDKFTYLKSSLLRRAAETISGLPITSANYDSAWQLLEKQFGDKQRLISNFMDRLVKLPAVAEGKDVGRLRSFVGRVEVIIRGLQSLSVDQSTFGSLLIPILLGKLPEDIKLQVTRLISSEIWNLKELLELLSKEVEAREKCDFSVQRAAGGNKPALDRGDSDGTAGSFVAKLQVKGCVFCNGNHTSHKCSMIQTPKERKRYLIEKGRCFKCLHGGHMSKTCQVKGCFRCGKEHHQAICFKSVPTTGASGNMFNSNRNAARAGNQHQWKQQNYNQGQNSLNSFHPPGNVSQGDTGRKLNRVHNYQNNNRPVGDDKPSHGEESSSGGNKTDSTSVSLCSSSRCLVLLETAVTTISNGLGESCKRRILLDKCSQQSYITEEFAARCGLEAVGQKSFSLNAFGSDKTEESQRWVYRACIQTLWGKVFVNLVGMPTICSPLLNPCNIQAIKGQHKYLSNLQLAEDFREDISGSLSVHILIGSDLYYQFVTSDVIVGGFGKKLSAVSSKFGWVLSGPITCGEGSSDS